MQPNSHRTNLPPPIVDSYMTCDVFLRSYAGDLAWVPYALRSLQKFVTGIRDIIISVPEEDLPAFKTLNLVKERLVKSEVPTGAMDPYLGQQADKLRAYHYTNADQVLFWDSDCIAVRLFSPLDLMIDDKPRWLMTPYSKLVHADGTPDTPWQPITQKAIGKPVVDFEFMRAHPVLAPREALFGFAQFMQATHGGATLEEYIAKQPNRQFSEWNALGAWSYYHWPYYFSFWNTEEKGVPEPFVLQSWSWGGLTPEIREKFERILA